MFCDVSSFWVVILFGTNVQIKNRKTCNNDRKDVILQQKQTIIIFFIYSFVMVKHIILWTLRPELSEEEKQAVKAGIKAGLEGLVGKVPGLLEVKVNIDGRLASSNADVMLDSTLESEEALKGYAVHPEHVAVANSKVRPYTVSRSCLDFEI
jgi:hypothetical protein